ncbi:SnoaL-like domain-containing protein [Janthinobacterium sp. HH01]|uniref:ester cyclase n=1 Tax=Janthinobacterium sp. HH01 TaxID=1198452 RepID=UPI0002AECE44|nr:ester cyclase [Janthinobacterium sp. HH01]ELX13930.1 SnoaL-like domain-containing protein [Janthinobacterium sp. HH01]
MAVNTSNMPSIAVQWMAAWNAKNPEAMAALFTPDGIYADFAFKMSAECPAGVARWVQMSIDHIPDLCGDILDAFQIGNKVSVRWQFSGTPLMLGPVPGTGKSYTVTVFSILEIRDGKILRACDCYNLADLLQQIDLPMSTYLPSASWRKI